MFFQFLLLLIFSVVNKKRFEFNLPIAKKKVYFLLNSPLKEIAHSWKSQGHVKLDELYLGRESIQN